MNSLGRASGFVLFLPFFFLTFKIHRFIKFVTGGNLAFTQLGYLLGLSLSCLFLKLCPVSLFRCFTLQSYLSNFITSGALKGRRERRRNLTSREGSRWDAASATNNHAASGPGQRHRCQRYPPFCLPVFMQKRKKKGFA